MTRRRAAGFTLIEAIIAMVLTGIVGAVAAVFLKKPVDAYGDSARRAELTDMADTALRRMVRDLRLALPNSVRTTTSGSNAYLEFLLTSGGGRYRAQPTSGGTGDPLDFDAADASFDVIGAAPACGTGQYVAIFNLGPAVSGADAYAGDNIAACSGVSGSVVSLAAAFRFPFESPGHRFQVVDTPVTYEYVAAAGELRRHWGYGISASQATPPTGGSSALLAQNLTAAAFEYSALVLAQRAGAVALSLSITRSGETIRLTHQAHVSNIP